MGGNYFRDPGICRRIMLKLIGDVACGLRAPISG